MLICRCYCNGSTSRKPGTWVGKQIGYNDPGANNNILLLLFLAV